jgi:hypothetical protein
MLLRRSIRALATASLFLAGTASASLPAPVAPAPMAPALPESFEQAYVGTFGVKARVWVHLKRDGAKLSGRYRYSATSREDLRLEGTLNEATRTFDLAEKNVKGGVTGHLTGTLGPDSQATGTWTSPDGAKRVLFSLEPTGRYPEIVALPGGARIVPFLRHGDSGKGCTSNATFPVFEGLASKKAASALERTLKQRLRWDEPFLPENCVADDPELPVTRESSYEVTGVRAGLLALELTHYDYTGGAHGLFGSACVVADLEKGVLQNLAHGLKPAALTELGALVVQAFKNEHHVANLKDAGFFDDTIELSKDATLCFTEKAGLRALEVVFQPYEVSPYAMGAPRAVVSADVARRLFKPASAGERLFQ